MSNVGHTELTVMDYHVLDRIPSGVGVYDVTGDRVELHYLNDGYYQMIGAVRENRDEYLGDRVISAVHPDDRGKIVDEAHACVRENRLFQQRFRILGGNRSYLWIEIRANHTPLSANTERFFASYYNVDAYVSRQSLLETKHADLNSLHSALEKEKRRNDTLMEKILSTTQTAIFWKDVERRFMGVNRAFLDYYGFTDESVLIGKTDEDMGWHSDPDPYKNDELQVITTGRSTYRVHGKCLAHGESRDIVASKSPLFMDGKIAGLVGSFEDVTTEYRQREEIERLNGQLKLKLETEKKLKEKAQAANEAKTEFLSRVSHDMRTPLNVILGMNRMAAEQNNPDATKDCLAKIDTSSRFLLGLINDVLDLAKMERGSVELRQELYPHDEFIQYIDAVIKPLCAEKGVKLVIEERLADGYVLKMDKLHSNQVAFNILSNAVKFTPRGGTVTLRQIERLTEDGKIDMRVIVSDTGIGMSKAFQKTLFQPFTQEIRNDTSLTRGAGLGLSIAKELADLMHATIKVESRLNRGTTVTMHGVFDCVSVAEFDTLEAKHPRKEHAKLAGARILLCEDHPLNQEIARALLADQKMLVDTADNGQIGVEMFEKAPAGYYQVILMDIRMPVMDGYMATDAIRSSGRPDAKTVPILAMSADVLADDVQKCLNAGMNGHIAKPVEPETMFGTLEECLKVKRRRHVPR